MAGADNEELCLLGEEVRVGSRNHQIFTRVQTCLLQKSFQQEWTEDCCVQEGREGEGRVRSASFAIYSKLSQLQLPELHTDKGCRELRQQLQRNVVRVSRVRH